ATRKTRSPGPQTPQADPRLTVCRLHPRPTGSYVLYLMSAYRRAQDNLALAHALARADAMDKPLVVVETLARDEASDRSLVFVMEGARETRDLLASQGIPYAFALEPPLDALTHEAALVVTDWFPTEAARARLALLTSRAPCTVECYD